jgi:hypothetical protein
VNLAESAWDFAPSRRIETLRCDVKYEVYHWITTATQQASGSHVPQISITSRRIGPRLNVHRAPPSGAGQRRATAECGDWTTGGHIEVYCRAGTRRCDTARVATNAVPPWTCKLNARTTPKSSRANAAKTWAGITAMTTTVIDDSQPSVDPVGQNVTSRAM